MSGQGNNFSLRILGLAVAIAVAVSGCGGSDGPSATSGGSTPVSPAPVTPAPIAATTQITGTAAVGAPLIGASVQLRCDAGETAAATTDNNGAWSSTVTTASLPCAIRVTGGSIGAGGSANADSFFSVTLGSAATLVANVTPLTTLALSKANGTALTDSAFAALATSVTQRLAAAAESQVTALAQSLTTQGYAVPGDFNPFTAAFVPQAGNGYDDLLEQLRAALAKVGNNYAQLMSGYAGSATLPAKVTPANPTAPDGKQKGGITFPAGGQTSRTAADVAQMVGTYQGSIGRVIAAGQTKLSTSCSVDVTAGGAVTVATPDGSYTATMNGELGDQLLAVPSANLVNVIASSTAVADQATGVVVQATVVNGFVTKVVGRRGFMDDQKVECYLSNPNVTTVGTTTTQTTGGATASSLDASWVGTFANTTGCQVVVSNAGAIRVTSGATDATATLGGDEDDYLSVFPSIGGASASAVDWTATASKITVVLNKTSSGVYTAVVSGTPFTAGSCFNLSKQ